MRALEHKALRPRLQELFARAARGRKADAARVTPLLLQLPRHRHPQHPVPQFPVQEHHRGLEPHDQPHQLLLRFVRVAEEPRAAAGGGHEGRDERGEHVGGIVHEQDVLALQAFQPFGDFWDARTRNAQVHGAVRMGDERGKIHAARIGGIGHGGSIPFLGSSPALTAVVE